AKVYAGEVGRFEEIISKGGKRMVSDQEYQVAKAQRDKYGYDSVSKKEGIRVAERELDEARTQVQLHTLRNNIQVGNGSKSRFKNSIIKTIYKGPGEAVKNQEAVMLLQNISKLRAEGLVDEQYLHGLEEGMEVFVEASQRREPLKTFPGHQ